MFVSLTLLLQKAHAQANWQSHRSIRSSVKAFIASKIKRYPEIDIQVNAMDNRLRLAQCSQPLETFSSRTVTIGRLTIGVRCTGKQPWSIYTSAQVSARLQVVVLAKPLQRGEIINADAVVLELQEISKTEHRYLTAINQAIGKQAGRHLPTGTILNAKNVQQAKIIKRGQKVTIQAGANRYSVRMSGLAMMDGAKHQRIRVKNESSQRIIEATVINAGLVSVFN